MMPTARMLLALALLISPAVAAEPVRHIGIYVQPYYAAAETPDAPPMVDVGAIFLSELPARSGDRAALLDRSIAGLKASAAREREFLEDPANLAGFKAMRQDNEMDEKFCWR